MQNLVIVLITLNFFLQIASAQSILQSFGTGANQFTIEFVEIGNPGNQADNTGYGSVSYLYNIGKYEISRDIINKANQESGLGITLFDMTNYGGNSNLNRPASGITWKEAARFVNWLNTSKGSAAAYKFDLSGNYQIWTSADSGFNPANPYRNNLARYWLPSADEWYKSAYSNPTGNWFDFANGGNTAPNPVVSGTGLLDAVYGQATSSGPAEVNSAGGLSPWGTMAQSGNVWEWTESAYDGVNNDPNENRERRGGSWYSNATTLGTSQRHSYDPAISEVNIGFRVAELPEPSALSLFAVGLGVVLRRRRRTV